MRKILSTIILIMCTSCVFVGCVNTQSENKDNQNNENKQEIQEGKKEEIIINEGYDVKEEFKEIIQNTRLNSIEAKNEEKDVGQNMSGETNEISSGDVKKEIRNEAMDFSDLPGVTYEHIEEVKDRSITDVWLIKMSNAEQYEKILKKVTNRLDELKEEYKDNKYITAILKKDENIRIKQEQGIVIAVFAADAGAIMSGIENSFREQEEIVEPEIVEPEIVESEIVEQES